MDRDLGVLSKPSGVPQVIERASVAPAPWPLAQRYLIWAGAGSQ
jgi:hypothetical protein